MGKHQDIWFAHSTCHTLCSTTAVFVAVYIEIGSQVLREISAHGGCTANAWTTTSLFVSVHILAPWWLKSLWHIWVQWGHHRHCSSIDFFWSDIVSGMALSKLLTLDLMPTKSRGACNPLGRSQVRSSILREQTYFSRIQLGCKRSMFHPIKIPWTFFWRLPSCISGGRWCPSTGSKLTSPMTMVGGEKGWDNTTPDADGNAIECGSVQTGHVMIGEHKEISHIWL